MGNMTTMPPALRACVPVRLCACVLAAACREAFAQVAAHHTRGKLVLRVK